jgi:Zn finger protein HypA/HybF involved in hydrogenase expression
VNSHVSETGEVTFTQDDDAPKMFMFVCFPVNVMLTTGWFYFWLVRKRRDDAVESLPSHLSLRRISRPADIAERMGITSKEMDRVMKICMKEGTVRGSFNQNGEFIIDGVKTLVIPPDFVCPDCGASVEKTYLEGEIVKCSYCNAPLDIPAQ